MPYLRIFSSPLLNRAPIFSKSDEQIGRTLYAFRESITERSFSVFAYEKYLRLLQKSRIAPFLFMSNEEHVFSMEIHHGTFIVIIVDNDTNNKLHNIVIDIKVLSAKFWTQSRHNGSARMQNKNCTKAKAVSNGNGWYQPEANNLFYYLYGGRDTALEEAWVLGWNKRRDVPDHQ